MTANYSDFDLKKYLREKAELVNSALNKFLAVEYPPLIYDAMRYSIFAGGKRLRPILVMEGARICGGKEKDVMPTACALEFIHTYSLIHDDLPAMDDDDYRRGQLTNHKKFGEAVAVLAGDALLTEAFALVAANAKVHGINPEQIVRVVELLAESSGVRGMVGGQLVDMHEDSGINVHNKKEKEKALDYIHKHKTVALIRASLLSGALLSGASPRFIKALDKYAFSIGLSFQIMDDLLDVIGDKRKLGKNGSDVKNKKLTYVTLYGLEASQERARRLVVEAKRTLRPFGKEGYVLESLADFIIAREY